MQKGRAGWLLFILFCCQIPRRHLFSAVQTTESAVRIEPNHEWFRRASGLLKRKTKNKNK
jgi:hypothetical protein